MVVLPPVIAQAVGVDTTRQPALDVMSAWHESSSNLAVVYGRPGSGKSFLLSELSERFTQQGPATVGHVHNYDPAGNNDLDSEAPDHSLFLIDNFDPLNSITGIQTSAPDLSAVAELLRSGHRLVLSTRRSRHDGADELARQLTHALRSDALGVREPLTVELVPWSLDEISAFYSTHGDHSAQRVCAYLREHEQVLGSEFRRPLSLRMLIMMGERLEKRIPKTLATVYDEYVSWALSRDYDRKQSVFREAHQRTILMRIAYDVFCGQAGTDINTYSVSRTRLTERVMEIVSQEPSLRGEGRVASYEWVADFLSSNHMLVAVQGKSARVHVSTQYAFDHPSFFEFFVAQAILDRLESDSSLGIRANALSEATFRSMVLYFVREAWDSADIASASAIASRPLTWPDRLLFLYMLETSDKFGDLLAQTDKQYFADLEHALPEIKSLFIQKAIKYQLVIIGRYSVWTYLEDIAVQETNSEESSERWLLAGGQRTTTEGLVARLQRPDLEAGAPIAIYRLGQMGDSSALPVLRAALQSSRADTRLSSLISRSIEKIEERSAGETNP